MNGFSDYGGLLNIVCLFILIVVGAILVCLLYLAFRFFLWVYRGIRGWVKRGEKKCDSVHLAI